MLCYSPNTNLYLHYVLYKAECPKPKETPLKKPCLLLAFLGLSIWETGISAIAQGNVVTNQHNTQPAPDYGSAHRVVDTLHDELISIMKRSDELGMTGRTEALQPILGDSMNLLALGIGAVGKRNWRTWEQPQQEQFIDVLLRSMAVSYASRFSAFNGQEFVITGNRQGPRGSVIIMTEVNSKSRGSTKIDYLMIERNGRWAIADIFLDGAISEVAMRRSEFSGLLRNDGFDALITAIEAKTVDRLSQ